MVGIGAGIAGARWIVEGMGGDGKMVGSERVASWVLVEAVVGLKMHRKHQLGQMESEHRIVGF